MKISCRKDGPDICIKCLFEVVKFQPTGLAVGRGFLFHYLYSDQVQL